MYLKYYVRKIVLTNKVLTYKRLWHMLEACDN